MGNGRQYWPWISLTDEIGAIRHLLTADVSGPVNLTGPDAGDQRRVHRRSWAGSCTGRPCCPVPAFALTLALGEFGRSSVRRRPACPADPAAGVRLRVHRHRPGRRAAHRPRRRPERRHPGRSALSMQPAVAGPDQHHPHPGGPAAGARPQRGAVGPVRGHHLVARPAVDQRRAAPGRRPARRRSPPRRRARSRAAPRPPPPAPPTCCAVGGQQRAAGRVDVVQQSRATRWRTPPPAAGSSSSTTLAPVLERSPGRLAVGRGRAATARPLGAAHRGRRRRPVRAGPSPRPASAATTRPVAASRRGADTPRRPLAARRPASARRDRPARRPPAPAAGAVPAPGG